jgi:hypothetical protein
MHTIDGSSSSEKDVKRRIGLANKYLRQYGFKNP